MKIKIPILLSLFLSVFTLKAANTQIGGELKKWHKVSLTFEGPETNETASPNPFTEYRLNVTFTHGDEKFEVPGYFAADGDAANTSATSGNKWRVLFSPNKTGEWTYKVSFRKGTNISISLSASAGTSAGFMDEETGSFIIAESDKTGRDHRAKGRLQYVGEHYLQYAETGEYFVKVGADAPENTLAYNDFDDVPNCRNLRKTWQPHQKDYDAADASAYTWKNGKGTELLGAIKYLSDVGANAFSFLTFSLGGDDRNVFPHLLKIPVADFEKLSGPMNGQDGPPIFWNTGVYKTRFDVSRMAQWEKIFEYGDKKGMFMHFKMMERENDNFMDNNTNGLERKVYVRELLARFGHHLALNWNLAEEISLPRDVMKSYAQFIADTDPYNHLIVFHNWPTEINAGFDGLSKGESALRGASNQIVIDGAQGGIHENIKRNVQRTDQKGYKWVISNDEQGPAGTGVDQDPKGQDLIRKKVVWGTLMAGGSGVEYYYGYQTGVTDLNAQSHHSREQKYKMGALALDFFRTYLPFERMTCKDEITSQKYDYAFVLEDSIYCVYLPDGGATNIDLPVGDWHLGWFNPRTGGDFINGGKVTDRIVAPDTKDWVGLIVKHSFEGNIYPNVTLLSPLENKSYESGDTVKIVAGATDQDGTITKVEFYNGETKLGESTRAPYAFKIDSIEPGNYSFQAKALDDQGAISVSQMVNITVFSKGCVSDFLEVNGLIVMEAESMTFGDEWQVKNEQTGFSGLGYITWEGDQYLETPGTGIVEAKVLVSNPGKYRVQFHSYVGQGTNATDHNDTWLRIPDADFYAQQGNNKKYSWQNGWFKAYTWQNPIAWTWSTVTVDNKGYQFYANFDKAGVYTVQLSARSNHHFIDKIILYKTGISENEATKITNPEVKCGGEGPAFNFKPTIKLLTPEPKAKYYPGDELVMQVEANDYDGEITKVEFFNGSMKLGQVNAAPYSFVIPELNKGSYDLFAIAYDNADSSTTSAMVSVVVSAPYVALNKSNWKAIYADSEDVDNGTVGGNGFKEAAIDGNINTFWHTRWKNAKDPLPHEIHIDLGATLPVDIIEYIPRQDQWGPNGAIGKYELYLSDDKADWGNAIQAGEFSWGDAPTQEEYKTMKSVFLDKTQWGRYLKVLCLSEAQGKEDVPFSNIAELNCKVFLTGIKLPDTVQIELNETANIRASTLPVNDITNFKIEWKSENTAVASVNEGGIKGDALGEAKITASIVNGMFTDTMLVKVVDSSTAIHQIGLLQGLYPNPSSGMLTFTPQGSGEMQIMDAFGKVVYVAQLKAKKQHLDLRFLQKGLYFVRFCADGGSVKTAKLVLR